MHAQDHASFDASTLEREAHTRTPARAVMPPEPGEAAICFLAPDSDAPLAWRPYRLHIGARLVLGRTDAQGMTAPLSSAERAGLTGWEVE